MPKIRIKGWVEGNEQKTNIPKICPKCGSKLHKTDSLKLCRMLFIYCPNTKCRWSEIYTE